MKKRIIFLCLLIFAQISHADQKIKIKHALFVGNSHTYVNDLALLVEGISFSNNPKNPVVSTMSVIGGASLEKHWNKGEVFKIIKKYDWQYAVLQDAGWSPHQQPKEFYRYVEKFHKKFKAKNVKTLLYLTWRYKKDEVEQNAINKIFFDTAKKLKLVVVPAGIAVAKVLKEKPGFELYEDDGVHMNPYGAYLVGSVFYSTIYNQKAALIKFSKLDPKRHGYLLQYGDLDKKKMQYLSDVAWNAVKRHAFRFSR